MSTSPAIEPHREQDVARRNFSRLDADRAHAVRHWTHRGADHPGSFGIVGLKPKNNTALARTGQTRIDPVKRPLLAVAPIVDDKIAVLQTELTQIVTVETCLADRVDPSHDRPQYFRIPRASHGLR